MGDELSMVCNHCQAKTGLLTEILQLVGEQLLGVVIINFIAMLQQLQWQIKKFTDEKKKERKNRLIWFIHWQVVAEITPGDDWKVILNHKKKFN